MSVYRVTEIIGTSSTSWEDAAAEAIRTAAGTIRDLRVAEVVKQDIHLDEGGRSPTAPSFNDSFKYEHEHIRGYPRAVSWQPTCRMLWRCPLIGRLRGVRWADAAARHESVHAASARRGKGHLIR